MACVVVAKRNQANERGAAMTENTPSPLNNVITIDDERIKSHLDRVVRGTVEETLNALLDAEADRLCNAQRYERSEARRDTRAGHYERGLQTKAGEVRLRVPKLRQGRRGAQRLAAGCDRRERERLSGDSRHLRGGEGGQEWLERVPQASQGTRVEGRPAHHLGCLHWACRERRRVLSRSCLAKVRRASRTLDQGAGDRGHAQGDPRQRGHRGSAREGHPSDRETAWPAPGQGRRAGGSGGR